MTRRKHGTGHTQSSETLGWKGKALLLPPSTWLGWDQGKVGTRTMEVSRSGGKGRYGIEETCLSTGGGSVEKGLVEGYPPMEVGAKKAPGLTQWGKWM